MLPQDDLILPEPGCIFLICVALVGEELPTMAMPESALCVAA